MSEETKYGLTADARSQGIANVMGYQRVKLLGVAQNDVQDVAAIVWDYVNFQAGGDGLDNSLCKRDHDGLVLWATKAVKDSDTYKVLPLVWIILIKFIVGLLIDWWLTKHKFVVSECGDPD